MEGESQTPDDHKVWSCLQSYVSFTYKHPFVVLLLSFAFLVGMVAWLFGVYGFSVNAVIPNYRNFGGSIDDKWDSFASARAQTYYSTFEKNSKTIEQTTLSEMVEQGVIVYERRGKNILTVETLRDIWRLEDEIMKTKGWEDYCYKPSGTCQKLTSLIEIIKTTIMWTKGKFNPQPEDLDDSIIASVLINQTIAVFLGRNTTSENKYSEVMRSIVALGTPQKGYKNAADRADEQSNNIRKWGDSFVAPIKKFQKDAPNGTKAYPYIPGPADNDIEQCIVKQVLWLIGSFGFLFVFSVFHMKGFFVSIFGVIGIFFSIPCAYVSMKGILQIEHFDALNVIGLFLICGIGSDCLFILYDLVCQSSHFEGLSQEQRLGWATQHGLIALATSLSTAAISFLALCSASFRIMQFFGIFCFLELFYDFVFTFTWYLAILAIYMKYLENKSCCKPKGDAESKDLNSQPLMSSIRSVESVESIKIEEYPDTKWYDCFRKKPTFGVNSSGLNIKEYNAWERFFHNYLAPFVYFYRAPIVILFLTLAVVMGYFTFQMQSAFEIQFLDDEHPLQRGYTLLQDAFSTAYLDFSLVYVWGTDGKAERGIKDFVKADGWGTTHFINVNFSDPRMQQAIYDSCEIFENDTTLIDHSIKTDLICPIRIFQEYAINQTGHFPVTPKEFDDINIGFQDYLFTHLGTNEPTLELWKATNQRATIGFSFDDNKLKYIAMKAPMLLPKDRSSDSLHVLYDKSQEIEKKINNLMPVKSEEGFTTSNAWTQMETQDSLEPQAIIDVAASILFACICIFISTMSISYTLFVAYSMVSVVLTIIGILYFNGWTLGVKEAIMISIASGYCADFIIQPMLAMAHDMSSLSIFGKLQNSLTMFASPVSSALCTTVAAAAFLFPSEIVVFSPFATFLCMSGGFGIVYGFIVLPAICSWIGPKKSDSLRQCCKKK